MDDPIPVSLEPISSIEPIPIVTRKHNVPTVRIVTSINRDNLSTPGTPKTPSTPSSSRTPSAPGTPKTPVMKKCSICREEVPERAFSTKSQQCNMCRHNKQVKILAMQIRAKELENENLRLQLELCKLQLLKDNPKQVGVNSPPGIYSIREESPRTSMPTFGRFACKDQFAREWIHSHEPDGKESLNSYYNRYSEDAKNPIHHDKFNKLVENFGYVKKNNGNFRYWVKKN